MYTDHYFMKDPHNKILHFSFQISTLMMAHVFWNLNVIVWFLLILMILTVLCELFHQEDQFTLIVKNGKLFLVMYTNKLKVLMK